MTTTTRTIPAIRFSAEAVLFRMPRSLVTALSALILSCQTWALEMPSIFGRGMVLQREKPLVVWGWTAPGGLVDLSFAGQSRSATADLAGRWEVTLDPLPASSEPRRMTISSAKGDTRVYDNVLVGDVWILAGQSNMGWPLSACDGGAEAARQADFPWLRVFHQAATAGASDEPARDVSDGKWSICGPQNAGEISGVGFFFARALHAAADLPVALVKTDMGGTSIQCWIDNKTLLSMPQSARYLAWERDARRTHAEDEAEWISLTEKLEKQGTEARRRGESAPAKLGGRLANGPPLGEKMFRRHSALFNGKVAPIQPFAARGVIWFQGEGNTMEAEAYGPMLEALILRWRDGWRDPQLPFLVVQLPRFLEEGDRAGVREAQETVARNTKGVHLAVTIDTGRPNDPHPGDKLPIGERLARLARREILGEQGIAARAPRAISALRNEDSVEVGFELDGATLQKTPDPLAGFAWVDAAGKSHAADAAVIGPDRVRVAAPVEAVSITYAFASWPEVSLFDTSGLPAAPFRLPIGPPRIPCRYPPARRYRRRQLPRTRGMRGPQPNILKVYRPILPHFPRFECVDSPSVVSHAIGFRSIPLMASVQAEVELRVIAARVDTLGGLRLAHLGHEHLLGHAPVLRVRIDGRRILMARIQAGGPGVGFWGGIGLPVELTLRTTGEGLRLFAYPVKELETLRSKTHEISPQPLLAGTNALAGVKGELLEIEADISVGQAEKIGFYLRGIPVVYEAKKQELVCQDRTVPLKPVDGRIRLRAYVDRTCLNIFANDGEVYMPMAANPAKANLGLSLATSGEGAEIRSLQVHELSSIWKNKTKPPL